MTRIHADVRSRLPLLFGLALVAAYLFITIWELARSSYDIAGVFLVAPVLAVVSIPLLARARRTEPDPWVGQGGYLVYSWLAFWGLHFCYRAFRTAMPGG